MTINISVPSTLATGVAVVLESVLPPGAVWRPEVGAEVRELVRTKFGEDTDSERKRLEVIENAVAVLSRCIPRGDGGAAQTGLVVGQVQSGKTLSFTAVAALARDNNYELIVALTGTSTSLANQSDARLREDLRLDTERDRKWLLLHNPKTESARQLTQVLRDWADKRYRPELKQSVLLTVMKNHIHLANLRDLLSQLDLRGITALVIDDEADQASMNTMVKANLESPTYSRIGQIRNLLPRHTFVQYTATPQAPLLIALTDTLSPDFVKVLEPGDGYVGGEDLFSRGTDAVVRAIPADDLHDDPTQIVDPCPSLVSALRLFFIGVAAEYVDRNPSGNRSMLVHPSHRRDSHGVYANWVRRLKQHWEDLLDHSETEAAQELLQEFEAAYLDLARTVQDGLPQWTGVRENLSRAIRLTHVEEVNARRGQTPTIEWSLHYSWILVAGQAVDRGFTVKGLTVTYMPRGRGVGNADTLQQRGRFFGYKEHYLGYCRIFLPADVLAAFRSYVDHEQDMHNALSRQEREGRSLKDWKREFIMADGLNPTRLGVVSLDYMQDFFSDEWWKQNFPLLAGDRLQENRTVVSDFLGRRNLTEMEGHDERTSAQRHQVDSDVPLSAVLDELLVPYAVAPEDAQEMTGLLLQLRFALRQNPNESCYVAVMSPGEDRRRSVDEKTFKVKQLHQGEAPVQPRQQRGSVYPGDAAIKDPDRVSVQVISLTLTKERGGESIATGVRALAIWVPHRLMKTWVVEA